VVFFVGTYLEIVLKILFSILLAGMIGLERERHSQPAGLKTHIILCVGATLITIVSIDMAYDATGRVVSDPTRIAANIVTGIGFLGGGAILRLGATVRGLTTAASLWAVAGVGMAVGAGYYFAASLTILTILLTLHFLGRFEHVYLQRKSFKAMTLYARSSPDLLGSVEKVLSESSITIRNIEIERDITEPNLEVRALLIVPGQVNLNKVSEGMFQIPGVIRFELD
jgi:putative Mg2+ transporter-C (MgtC) family protein